MQSFMNNAIRKISDWRTCIDAKNKVSYFFFGLLSSYSHHIWSINQSCSFLLLITFFLFFFCYSSLFSLHFASTRPKCAINMKRGIYFLIVQEKIFVVVVAKMEYPK